MASSNRFPNLSAKVLNALDRDFPGWQDLVPTEKDSELNEESLIDLLKDRKRAEIYRTVVDKRNAFLKEAYEGSDKSFAELTQEFASFSYEQTHKWFDIEEKLSSIKLEFRVQPKNEPIKVEKIGESVDAAADIVNKQIDLSINSFNDHMDNYLVGFFNKDVNGISRVGSDDLKGFLRTKVDQFKEEHKRIGSQQKELVNNSIKKLIKDKVDKIKAGELSADALNRSDLFTDEEISSVARTQEKIILDAVVNRRKSNVDTANEMSQKFIGVSGKENILRKLEECPDHIISPEVKIAVSDAMDYGFMLEEADPAGSSRKTRAVGAIVADAACIVLDTAAFALEQMEDPSTTERFKNDKTYKFCNYDIGFWAHIVTLGWCTGYTIGANIRESKSGGTIDYKGIANILSGFSFLIGIFSVRKWTNEVVKKVKGAVAGTVMQQMCDKTGEKIISSVCSAAILIKSVGSNAKKITKNVRNLLKTKL